mgnify:FL=1
MTKISAPSQEYAIENINVYSNLTVFTFSKNKETHKKIDAFYQKIREKNGFVSITEGVHEITMIVSSEFAGTMKKNLKPKKEFSKISAIGIKFSEKYATTPGFMHNLFQHMAMQNINVVEVSSTYTEITFYIHVRDSKLAFDTLFSRFVSGKNE